MPGTVSAVSWGSIAAGGIAAAALSLALLALGVGLGLASVSPWENSGVSASTFNNITGAYLVIMAVMSSAVGGYLAARMRTKGRDYTRTRSSSAIRRMASLRGPSVRL